MQISKEKSGFVTDVPISQSVPASIRVPGNKSRRKGRSPQQNHTKPTTLAA